MRGSVLKSPDAFRLSVKRWRRKSPTAYGSLKALKGSRLLRCHSWAKLMILLEKLRRWISGGYLWMTTTLNDWIIEVMKFFRNHLGFFNSLCSHKITSSRFICCTGLPDLPRQRERPGVEQGGKGEIVGFFFHSGSSRVFFLPWVFFLRHSLAVFLLFWGSRMWRINLHNWHHGTEIKFSAHIFRYSTPESRWCKCNSHVSVCTYRVSYINYKSFTCPPGMKSYAG